MDRFVVLVRRGERPRHFFKAYGFSLLHEHYEQFVAMARQLGLLERTLEPGLIRCGSCGSFVVSTSQLRVVLDAVEGAIDDESELTDALDALQRALVRSVPWDDEQWSDSWAVDFEPSPLLLMDRGEVVTDDEGDPLYYLAEEVAVRFDVQCDCDNFLVGSQERADSEPRTAPKTVRYPDLFHRWRSYDLADHRPELYTRLRPEDEERLWRFIEKNYLDNYWEFVRVGFQWGLSRIPFPGAVDPDDHLLPNTFFLPRRINLKLEEWCDSINPMNAGIGSDWEKAVGWGMELAKEIREEVPPEIYIEYRPFRELVIVDRKVVELEVPDFVRMLGQGSL